MTNITPRDLEESTESNEGNVGIALALVCGAGLSTALGASLVFFPSLVKLASRRVLASSLGISAGVMIYVSFAEIFVKSQEAFADSGMDDDMSFIYATLCLFGGMIFMVVRIFHTFHYYLFYSQCIDLMTCLAQAGSVALKLLALAW